MYFSLWLFLLRSLSHIFEKVEFRGNAYFNLTEFDKARFTNTKFNSEEIIFTGASFREVHFIDKTIFAGEADFSAGNFQAALFNNIIFGNQTKFNLARFDELQADGVYFAGEADFSAANFQAATFNRITFEGRVRFYQSMFEEARFSQITFKDEAYLNFVLFKEGDKILLDIEDLSKVSFRETDITRVRFAENAVWGGLDGFEVIDETKLKNPAPQLFLFNWNDISNNNDDEAASNRKGLQDFFEKKFGIAMKPSEVKRVNNNTIEIPAETGKHKQILIKLNDRQDKAYLIIDKQCVHEFIVKKEEEEKGNNGLAVWSPEDISLGAVLTVYRNLRENYEFRLRYEEADKFYKKERELKRKYREKQQKGIEKQPIIVKKNCWFRENLSLTGLYYWISEYGQNYKRPALIAASIIALQMLYAVSQANILIPPSFSSDYFAAAGNAMENSFSRTFQLDDEEELIDFFLRIVTIPILGALFIAALKRTFEKKFRRG